MCAFDKELLVLPKESIIGDFIAYIQKRMNEPITKSYSLGGGEYFERARELGLYLKNELEVREKVKRLGLLDRFRGRRW
jgi:hypothetical protein